jgi:amino acid transporter
MADLADRPGARPLEPVGAGPDGGRGGRHLLGSSFSVLKHLLVGRPLATQAADAELLTKRIALPEFSSDAISSTAYGTEVILVILVPVAGMAAFGYLVPLSLVVIGLLVLLVASYRQTIYAYPTGGGSYIVSRENLGTNASLVAAAALLVDYTLNVAVSAAAGAAAISSAITSLQGHLVSLSVGLVVIIMVANLRGLRQAGRLFALPVYAYVAALVVLIVDGLVQTAVGDLHRLPVNHAQLNSFTHNGALVTGVTVFALLKAFSSGAVALSGVEAISNGVPAFREPKSRNASVTLTWTGIFLGGPLLGLAVLTSRLKPTISRNETLLSILGDHVFGRNSPLYVVLMASTAAILCLSANTSFADYPRLSSVVARDGFLPRQFSKRGDRLVFSNGIIAVALTAIALLWIFGGKLDSLIPLFAVGLFTAFTLSQVGMVRHHRRLREPRWRRGVAINAVGATATTIVLGVVVVTKFTAGAWIPAVLIPAIVVVCKTIKRHYDQVEHQLTLTSGERLPEVENTVVVPIDDLNHGSLAALAYARSMHPHRLLAVTVDLDGDGCEELQRQWASLGIDVPLEVVDSPYREITRPILRFLDDLDRRHPRDVLTVIIPEVVVHRWWQQFLHNQTALVLKARLLFRPNTIVISVPAHIP